jgi:ABC-type Zn2+ transport system substrate-binding protein/surface adhesin
MVDTLANDMEISVGRLDPLGSDLDVGAQLWFGMMNNLAASLTRCLDPG